MADVKELVAEYDSTAGIPSRYAVGLRWPRNALVAARKGA